MDAQRQHWLDHRIDLGAGYNITEVKLNWEIAYAKVFRIQIGDDPSNWTAIKSIIAYVSSGLQVHNGLSGGGRYARIDRAATSTANNIELLGSRVNGDQDDFGAERACSGKSAR